MNGWMKNELSSLFNLGVVAKNVDNHWKPHVCTQLLVSVPKLYNTMIKALSSNFYNVMIWVLVDLHFL